MQPSDISKLLARLPHFRRLPANVLQAVVATSSVINLRAGDDVFREGQTCDGFFVVATGRVKLFRVTEGGREQVVHDVPAGQTFAEGALFLRGRYPAWAAALESPTQLIKLHGEQFLKLFASEPQLAASMVGSLCGWLHSLLGRVQTLSIVSAEVRLAHHLLRLPARHSPDSVVITLPVSKKDLASELSITPETLSRLFGKWRKAGLITVDGAKVTLLDVDAFAELDSGGLPD
ncbi:MAG: CRP-like cAMP-binding protein [Pseudohongiellaceae bacterium]|jgi:CRP-like cAMP-binding protein